MEKTYVDMFNKGKPYWVKRKTLYDICIILSEKEEGTRREFSVGIGDKARGFDEVKSFVEKIIDETINDCRKKLKVIDISGYLPPENKNEILDCLDKKGIDYKLKQRFA